MASKFHLGDGGIIDFNSSALTLTHTTAGLTLGSTKKLMFNDATQFIQGSSGTVLSLGATDEIDLTATTVQVNGITSLTGALNVTGATTMTGSLTLGATGGGNGSGVILYGNTNNASLQWDETADDLILNGAAGLRVTGATQLTGATTLSSTLGVSGITTLSGTHSDVSSDTKIVVIDPTSVTTENSSSISLVASLYVDEPNITLGTSASLTTGASLYVNGAPTEGTINYAAYIAGDTIITGGSMTVTGGESFFYGPQSAISGSSNTITTAVNINPMITFASSQTIGKAVSLYLDEPAITPAGSTITDAAALWIAGAPTEGTNNYAAYIGGSTKISGSISGASGASSHFVNIDPTITTANSSNIGLVASLYVDEPNITLGTSANVYTAASLYVNGTPTEGTNNYAAYISGNTYLTGSTITNAASDYKFLHLVQSLNDSNLAGGSETYTSFGIQLDTVNTTGWQNVYLIDAQTTGSGNTFSSVFSVTKDGNTSMKSLNVNNGTITVTGNVNAINDSANTATGAFNNVHASGLSLEAFASSTSEALPFRIMNSSYGDTATKVSMRFDTSITHANQASYVDSGKITVSQEQAFTSTAGTQDSRMGFYTTLNGTSTEQMALTSAGALKIGAYTYTFPTTGVQTDYVLKAGAVSSNDVTLAWASNSGGSGATALTGLSDVLIETDSLYIGPTKTDMQGRTDSANYNIGIGVTALDAITTGDNNTAIGYQAATALTEGTANTILGSGAGAALTVGEYNTAIGFQSLKTNVDGDKNTAIGYESLYTMEPSSNEGNNTALGYQAGKAISTGLSNVLIGSGAGVAATTVGSSVIIGKGAGAGVMTSDAIGTVAIGASAGAALTSGACNIAIGYQALDAGDTTDNNTAIGYQALSGLDSSDQYGNNVAIGYQSGLVLNHATTAIDNIIIGSGAGVAATTVGSSVIIGKGAGAGVMTSDAIGTVAIGASAGAAITSGQKNTAIGYQALDAEDDGDSCVAIGYQALTSQTGVSGEVGNVAIGSLAADAITTGKQNTIIGTGAGGATVDVDNTVIIGYGAGAGVITSTADGTVAIGASAGAAITSGAANTVIGYNSGFYLITGEKNTAIGYGSLDAQVYGDNNTALGYDALTANATTDGNGDNTAIGYSAGSGVTSGTKNTLLGSEAGVTSAVISSGTSASSGGVTGGSGTAKIKLASGSSDTNDAYDNLTIEIQGVVTSGGTGTVSATISDYVGSTLLATLSSITLSGSTVSISTAANDKTYEIISTSLTTGANNTFIGYGAGGLGTVNNQTSLGYQAGCFAANQITLGNPSVTALRCADSTIATLSDSRDKENVSNSTYGLSFINSLRPVQYRWNRRHLEEGDADSVLNGKTRVGFLAQELQSAMPNNENEILDLVYDVNPERLEAKYGNLIPIMAKAIQDLSAANDALVARVTALENA
jgi:trimeric autotransporter adhesin